MMSSLVDNKNRFKETIRWNSGNPNQRYPIDMWLKDDQYPNEWSIEYLEGYIADTNDAAKTLGSIWRCPTLGSEANADELDRASYTAHRIDIRYAVFTGVDVWGDIAASNKAKQELVGMEPGTSDQVMMSDPLYRWHVTGAWAYNHGLDGPSVHFKGNNGVSLVDFGPPRIEGVNQMKGDMSVQWKPGSEYDTSAMQSIAPYLGWVKGALNDTTFY